jgi:hypothetical protein
MRVRPYWLLAGAALLGCPRVAFADEEGTTAGWSLAAAGAIDVAGFVAGSTLLARGQGDHFRDNAGWLTIESGFVLSPFAAHAVSGEWGRGTLFAMVPLSTLAVTLALFQMEPDTVESGTLVQQRWMWAMFGAGLFASGVGVVDSLWAPARSQRLSAVPLVGPGQAGLAIGGSLW